MHEQSLILTCIPQETTASQLDIVSLREKNISMKIMSRRFKVKKKTKRQKVHILQTISDYELNLPLTHTKD